MRRAGCFKLTKSSHTETVRNLSFGTLAANSEMRSIMGQTPYDWVGTSRTKERFVRVSPKCETMPGTRDSKSRKGDMLIAKRVNPQFIFVT